MLPVEDVLGVAYFAAQTNEVFVFSNALLLSSLSSVPGGEGLSFYCCDKQEVWDSFFFTSRGCHCFFAPSYQKRIKKVV